MTTIEFISAGPEDTAAIGRTLAATLAPDDLVFLHGDLGAGKSTLVRAAGAALGVRGPMPSPTFTVVQLHRGRVPVAHMDAYRLRGADEEEGALLVDALAGAVGFVEWPEAVADLLAPPRFRLQLEHGGGDRRLIALTVTDPADCGHFDALAADLRARHSHHQPERRGPGG